MTGGCGKSGRPMAAWARPSEVALPRPSVMSPAKAGVMTLWPRAYAGGDQTKNKNLPPALAQSTLWA
uniref:Uncharacterized protein n=1 Tax=Rhizoctonia solani TaxID=456999 RepID=N0ACZ8_9AGAM|nr:hypothetical protein RSOL_m01450 [Rhizoctonia solani]AGK45455.1 hypothetical protein RSOL_m01450 [Rhizoctonia solani]